MQCPECETFPDVIYPETDLYFWLPLTHTQSKIVEVLRDLNLQFTETGERMLRVNVQEPDIRPFLIRVRGALTGAELSGANALALPRG